MHEKDSDKFLPLHFFKIKSGSKIFSYFKFAVLLCLSAGIINCSREKKPDMSKTWDSVVKDLEIVMISPESDSIKALQITEIFNKYNVTFNTYREFYESMLQGTLTQNIDFLKRVEKTISETMSARAREELKLYNKQIILPQNKDSTRFKKDIKE